MEKAKTLGILGGLGPMAGVYFYEKVTALTKASCDQEHINVILAGLADTPDRTDFILGKSTVDPTPRMVESAKILERAGADVIAMPCNTAHYFYDAIAGSIHIPMLNIIEETLKLLAGQGARKIGLLATEGTIAAGTYPAVAQAHGIECAAPTPEEQAVITAIIYQEIKCGRRPDMRAFYRVANRMLDDGCDFLVLGCTELSLLERDYHLGGRFVDSVDALARATVLASGKTLCDAEGGI